MTKLTNSKKQTSPTAVQKKMEELNIIQLNINGVQNKIEDLKVIIVENQPDILFLNETKLYGNMTLELENYNSIICNRDIQNIRNRGGGVAVLIKDGIKYSNIQKYQIEKHELIKLSIHTQKGTIDLISCYIPPQVKLNLEILEL